MDSIQENISFTQRNAIVNKAMDFESITYDRVASLKRFSADVEDKVWFVLTSNEVL